MMNDPIHQDNDGVWYFWDETGADRIGPFHSWNEAKYELDIYCREVLGQ